MHDHILGYNQPGEYRVESDRESFDFDTWIIWNVNSGLANPIEHGIKGIDNAFTRCRQLARGNLPRYEVWRDWQADEAMNDHDENYSIIDTWEARNGNRRVVTANSNNHLSIDAKEVLEELCIKLNKNEITEEEVKKIPNFFEWWRVNVQDNLDKSCHM